MIGRGVICMGNRGGEQTPGGDIGCLEGGRGVAGGGDRQLCTKHGELLDDVRIEEMVRSGGVRAPT